MRLVAIRPGSTIFDVMPSPPTWGLLPEGAE
jgi:hypothetical protein